MSALINDDPMAPPLVGLVTSHLEILGVKHVSPSRADPNGIHTAAHYSSVEKFRS